MFLINNWAVIKPIITKYTYFLEIFREHCKYYTKCVNITHIKKCMHKIFTHVYGFLTHKNELILKRNMHKILK